jgi:hypothetical protein
MQRGAFFSPSSFSFLLFVTILAWLFCEGVECHGPPNGQEKLMEDIAKSIGLLQRVTDFHNASKGNINGKPRNGTSWTWAQNFDLVTSQKHKWCKMQRDNWSCMGERYKEVLADTPPYDATYSLAYLPPGFRLYFEGNSYLAEQIYAALCNSPGVNEYKVYRDGIKNTNDLIVYDPLRNVSVLVIDNDDFLFKHRDKIGKIVRLFDPHAIVLGDINSGPGSLVERENFFSNNRNASTVFSWVNTLPTGCSADFKDCKIGGGHQCFPGPVFRAAENMISKAVGRALASRASASKLLGHDSFAFA